MSIAQDLRTRRRHRGLTPWQLVQKIGRLEREADNAACTMVGLATEVDELKAERNELKDSLDATGIEYAGALEDVAVANEENARLAAENARLRAALANATAVTVPPSERDTSAIEDQATAPAGIDVRPLWDALNPGRPRTTRGRDTDDTQPLPKATPAA